MVSGPENVLYEPPAATCPPINQAILNGNSPVMIPLGRRRFDDGIEVFAARSCGSEMQIAFVLKQAEVGITIGENRRKAGISDAPFCKWRKK